MPLRRGTTRIACRRGGPGPDAGSFRDRRWLVVWAASNVNGGNPARILGRSRRSQARPSSPHARQRRPHRRGHMKTKNSKIPDTGAVGPAYSTGTIGPAAAGSESEGLWTVRKLEGGARRPWRGRRTGKGRPGSSARRPDHPQGIADGHCDGSMGLDRSSPPAAWETQASAAAAVMRMMADALVGLSYCCPAGLRQSAVRRWAAQPGIGGGDCADQQAPIGGNICTPSERFKSRKKFPQPRRINQPYLPMTYLNHQPRPESRAAHWRYLRCPPE